MAARRMDISGLLPTLSGATTMTTTTTTTTTSLLQKPATAKWYPGNGTQRIGGKSTPETLGNKKLVLNSWKYV